MHSCTLHTAQLHTEHLHTAQLHTAQVHSAHCTAAHCTVAHCTCTVAHCTAAHISKRIRVQNPHNKRHGSASFLYTFVLSRESILTQLVPDCYNLLSGFRGDICKMKYYSILANFCPQLIGTNFELEYLRESETLCCISIL